MTLQEEIIDDFKNPKKKRKPRRNLKLKRQKSTQRKIATFLILTALAVTGVFFIAESYADWRVSHEWQFPARWVGFVREIEKQIHPLLDVEETKELTDMETIEQYHLSPVIKTVYFLESTSGKNDGCKEEGQVNGYGYRQNGSEFKCYNTFEAVTLRVNEWFEDRLSMNGNNLVEAVCYYNTGIQGQNVCDYSENFMGVLTKNF